MPSEAEVPCPSCGAEEVAKFPLVHLHCWECGSREYSSPHKFIQSPTCTIRQQAATIERMTELLREALNFIEHQNFRCEYKDRWPECPCGMEDLEKRINTAIAAAQGETPA